jgi:hypothetical protein
VRSDASCDETSPTLTSNDLIWLVRLPISEERRDSFACATAILEWTRASFASTTAFWSP